jgi:hypothetical protein
MLSYIRGDRVGRSTCKSCGFAFSPFSPCSTCLGFSLGKCQQETTLAIKALKRIDIDKDKGRDKKMLLTSLTCADTNPFE